MISLFYEIATFRFGPKINPLDNNKAFWLRTHNSSLEGTTELKLYYFDKSWTTVPFLHTHNNYYTLLYTFSSRLFTTATCCLRKSSAVWSAVFKALLSWVCSCFASSRDAARELLLEVSCDWTKIDVCNMRWWE